MVLEKGSWLHCLQTQERQRSPCPVAQRSTLQALSAVARTVKTPGTLQSCVRNDDGRLVVCDAT